MINARYGSEWEPWGKESRRLPWWEQKVTVCIAGICSGLGSPNRIILCTDWKVSNELGSAETKYKTQYLRGGWAYLTAGYESEINALGKLFKETFAKAQVITEENIAALVREPLRRRKNDKIDEYLYGRFGIGKDEFYQYGKVRFPEDIYRLTMAEISQLSIGAEFLVCGFCGPSAMIFKTNTRGHVSMPDEFATIGEGADLAMSSLLHRGYSDILDFPAALYAVYEAKRVAERVPSVGEATTLNVLIHGQARPRFVRPRAVDKLKKFYVELGPKPFPLDFDLTDAEAIGDAEPPQPKQG